MPAMTLYPNSTNVRNAPPPARGERHAYSAPLPPF